MSQDPYKILGIEKGATLEQIKKAYRAKAKKYHPDKGGDAWVFQQVQDAYETLTGKRKDSPPKNESKPKSDQASDTPPESKTKEKKSKSSDFGFDFGFEPQPERSKPNPGKKEQFKKQKPWLRVPSDQISLVIAASLAGIVLGTVLVGSLFIYLNWKPTSVDNRVAAAESVQSERQIPSFPEPSNPTITNPIISPSAAPSAQVAIDNSAAAKNADSKSPATPGNPTTFNKLESPTSPAGSSSSLPTTSEPSPTGLADTSRGAAVTSSKSANTTPPPPANAPFDANQAVKHQQAWAEHLGTPVEITNSIGMKLKLIPAGKFTMGDSKGEPDEMPYEATITEPYYLGVYEVTQAQYERVMGRKTNEFPGKQNPVQLVSWDEAMLFCRKLSEEPGEKINKRVYRLPSEAEWEYGCRAGRNTKFCFGDEDSELGLYAVYGKNSGRLFKGGSPSDGDGGRPQAVGQKQPNAWGLHDTHGNVWEWCLDWYGEYPKNVQLDPGGPALGTRRVVRGGSWKFSPPFWARSAKRFSILPDKRWNDLGFRVAMTIAD